MIFSQKTKKIVEYTLGKNLQKIANFVFQIIDNI
jgi:hypothetical protein